MIRIIAIALIANFAAHTAAHAYGKTSYYSKDSDSSLSYTAASIEMAAQ